MSSSRLVITDSLLLWKKNSGGEKNVTEKTQKCSDCEFQTNSEAALKKHIHAAHDSGEVLKCNKSALQHSVV